MENFLNTVLCQTGPSSLPYENRSKRQIHDHLLQLVKTYPSLQPKSETFTHNDGRTVNLLQADGTVPMTFHGSTYNIPIIIWLMESYPYHPPFVFVNPTRDMIIKRPHPFVSPNGVVSIPYINCWEFPGSNLVELGRNLCHHFASNPPLYSQRFTSNPNSGFGGFNSGWVIDDPNEVGKRDTINKLMENVKGDIRDMRIVQEEEIEGLFTTQSVLRKREEELRKGLRGMQDEKGELEQQLQMISVNTQGWEVWLKENEDKLRDKESDNVDVDAVFEPCDALSKQILECAAADLAVDDAIYALDRTLQEGVVPFDQYLKNVRLLSREQFFHRALASKVKSIQFQAQVASMAARVPQQYSY